ncbi:MAG: DUF4386 domain-containing protein [Pseudomonadota bacterium]
MTADTHAERRSTARIAGSAMLAMFLVGIAFTVMLAPGIDINLSADIEAVAKNMLAAEQAVRAKGYFSIFGFAMEAVFVIGLYLLVLPAGRLLAMWSLTMSLAAAVLSLLGAVFDLNVALFASSSAFQTLADESQRLLLAGTQVTSDYTSFHLGIVMGSLGKLGYFWLLLRSGMFPAILAGWGVFASMFVAFTIVARDFVPALGNDGITIAFMVSNMIAIVASALYLVIKGVRPMGVVESPALEASDAKA